MAVSETLELDISEALDRIQQVGSALQEIAEAFGQSLNEALAEALSDLPVVEPEINPDPAGQALEERLDEAVDEEREAVVEGDASAVTEAGNEAVEAIDSEVELDADASQITEEGNAAVEAIETEIELEVTADTSEAQAQIEALADSVVSIGTDASDASGGLAQLGDAAGVGGGAGGLAALGAQAVKANPKVAAVAAAATVTVGTLDSLRKSAMENITTTENFEAALGVTGQRILDMESGVTGFGTDLRQLAQDMGTSDEALMQQVQTLALFRGASGDTSDEVVDFSQNIVALATQIVANNPAIGSIDEVVRGLSRGLVTGGRLVQGYGLNFDSAAIQARAFELGLADTNGEVDRAGLQAAGLSLALEQLPPDYDKIVEAQDKVQISSQRTSQRFGDLQEELGKPLVEPFEELKEAAVSLAESFGAVLMPVMRLIGARLGMLARQASILAEGIKIVIDGIGSLISSAVNAIRDVPLLGSIVGFVADKFGDASGEIEGTESALDGFTQANDNAAAAAASGWTEFFAQETEKARKAAELLERQMDLAGDRMRDFQGAAQRHIPNVAKEFEKLGEDGMGVDQVLANLDEMFSATVTWTEQMAEEQRRGNSQITNLMAELGPEKSAIIAGLNEDEKRDLEEHLGVMALIELNARVNARQIALEQYFIARGETKEEAAKIAEAYRTELILGDITREQADEILETVKTSGLPDEAADLARRANKAAADEAPGAEAAGNDIAQGFINGIRGLISTAVDAAKGLAESVINKVNEVAGNSSPSRVFREIGGFLVEGLAQGLEDDRLAISSAEALAEAVQAPLDGVDLTAGTSTLRSVSISVPVTVSGSVGADAGREFGEQAAAAITTQLRSTLRVEGLVA